MTVSNFMPDVVVEIAFDSGYGTLDADRTWTDVSDYVELADGINITWGRQNERSQADPNQLSLTLDNSDGRFTAERVTGAYYPNVKLDRPIRVKATPVDGPEKVRFLGYINEWPVEWDGTDTYAKAMITASSRLSRVGYTATLKSAIEQAILADSPTAYYVLGEPSGATQANDSVGRTALLLAGDPTLPLVFGNATGPGTDSLTACQFAAGQYLRGSGEFLAAGSTWTLEGFFLTAGTTSALMRLTTGAGDTINVAMLTGQISVQVSVTTAGVTTIAEAITPLAYNDGATHHFAARQNGATLSILVDGVSVASFGSTPAVTAGGTLALGQFYTGVLAHVAMWGSTALSDAQILSHATAGLTGYAGETTDERVIRYAAYANIPADELDVETGSTTMAHVDTTGQQVVELMRLAETTEGGVLYDERDGTLTMHNRAHRYVVAAALTLDVGQHMVEVGYQPQLDRTYLVNDVTAANVAGTYSARSFDQQSVDDYGPMALQFTTASEDDDAPLQAASWLVGVYKNPGLRVASCGVDALAQVGKAPNCYDVLAVTVGSKITVGGHPQQMSYSSVDYFVEGGTETYGPESLRLTWNLSPTSPWDQTLILGDANRGFLGTNPLAY